MTGIVVDIAMVQFWIFIAVALAVLIPVRSDSLHQPLFAVINAAFIYILVGGTGLTGVVVLVAALWGLVRATDHTVVATWLFTTLVLALLIALKLNGGSTLLAPEIAIPLSAIGFSYASLRALDMMRTVRGGQSPAPGLVELFNYLLPFNMLAAGPIQNYAQYSSRPARLPALNLEQTLGATERIAAGVFKKFVLAATLAALFLTDFKATGLYFIIEMHIFYLWLYLDFSAYSDLAVGLGRLMGIQTPENFNRPLSSRNLTVFWQRWHISLAQFVRNNLYIPVQLNLARRTGNRRPVLISTVAFAVAFILCGLWHDISWRFFIWGAMHAAGLSLCNAYRYFLVNRLGKKYVREVYMKHPVIRAFSTVITFEFVALSLVIAFYPYSGV